MKKLRRRRCLELFIAIAATALVAVAPAGALAAGEESGGSTAGETGTESSSGSTEAAPPAASEEAPPTTAPASSGWVPQGTGTEPSSDEAASTRRGSSLGSGASSKQAGSAGEEPSYGSGSSAYHESESSTPSTFEAPASEPQAVSPVGSVERQAAAEPTHGEDGHVAAGAVTSAASSEAPRVADKSSVPHPAPVVNTHDRAASGSGGPPLPILIVGLLILVYAGARLLLGPVEPDLFRSGRFQRVRRVLSRV